MWEARLQARTHHVSAAGADRALGASAQRLCAGLPHGPAEPRGRSTAITQHLRASGRAQVSRSAPAHLAMKPSGSRSSSALGLNTGAAGTPSWGQASTGRHRAAGRRISGRARHAAQPACGERRVCSGRVVGRRPRRDQACRQLSGGSRNAGWCAAGRRCCRGVAPTGRKADSSRRQAAGRGPSVTRAWARLVCKQRPTLTCEKSHSSQPSIASSASAAAAPPPPRRPSARRRARCSAAAAPRPSPPLPLRGCPSSSPSSSPSSPASSVACAIASSSPLQPPRRRRCAARLLRCRAPPPPLAKPPASGPSRFSRSEDGSDPSVSLPLPLPDEPADAPRRRRAPPAPAARPRGRFAPRAAGAAAGRWPHAAHAAAADARCGRAPEAGARAAAAAGDARCAGGSSSLSLLDQGLRRALPADARLPRALAGRWPPDERRCSSAGLGSRLGSPCAVEGGGGCERQSEKGRRRLAGPA